MKSFFDEEARMTKISKIGDPLEVLNSIINWEMFRIILKKHIVRKESNKGGRPPFDIVMMFKILVLERLYNMSDDQAEFQINDRRSFMRFLGLESYETVPDAKTIWKFRDDLSKTDAIEECFHLFNEMLAEEGLITHSGTIIDATFVDAPRQRNTREENIKIKNGEVPEEWEKPENAETHFGYKDHVKCDVDSKLITGYGASAASLHDSQMCTELLDDDDKVFYADSAYSSAEIAANLPENCKNEICEKGYRGNPLTEEQKKENNRKSKIRCRIEHIFGFMTNSMKGITLRCIGFKRAWTQIGLLNLVYNMCRYRFLKRASA